MTTVQINWNGQSTSDNSEWNDVGASPTNLVADDGTTASGWSLTYNNNAGGTGTVGVATATGDAGWVDDYRVSSSGVFVSAAVGTYATADIGGLNNAKTYSFEFFSSGPDGRVTRYQVDDSATVDAANGDGAGNPNASNTVSITGVSPVSGVCVVKFGKADGSGTAYANAFRITEDPTPTVTTTDTLSPGTEFTLTATNYASAPVSPATLTDSQGSTITVPVTISGSGPYTAVGTMPTLAEAVTAGTSLLFGDVTIELTT